MKFSNFLTTSPLLIQLTTALTLPSRSLPNSVPKMDLIHQFPLPTFVENLHLRTTHPTQLLANIIGQPEVHLLNTSPPSSTLLATFPSYTSILGITSLSTAPETFYIVTSNFSLSIPSFGLGTATIHSLDLSNYPSKPAQTKLIASLPQAGFLNGLTTLSAKKGLILVADSALGCVWLIDVKTGTSKILLQEPEMAPPPNSTAVAASSIGINGLHLLSPSSSFKKDANIQDLYFSNTATRKLYRVPISVSKLAKAGPVVKVTDVVVDDFALDAERGVAWVAGGEVNTLFKVNLATGKMETVVGGLGSLDVAGATSVVLGKAGSGKVFVSTNGGMIGPVNGTLVEGGKVVGVEVAC